MAQKNKEETESLERKLVQITREDKSFTVDAAYLLKLSRNAGKLFESSKAPLKNKLLKIILSNLEFDDKILFYKRRAPFDVISECYQSSNWLRLQVTNSLTGVERYKSDTVCIELDRNNNEPRGGVAVNDNEQLRREFTDEELRRLVDYFSLLIEMDQHQKAVEQA